MPSWGKAADSTALPQPPNTSQKVPTNSAAARFESGMEILLQVKLVNQDRLPGFDFDLLTDGLAAGWFYPDLILAHRKH